MRFYKQMQLHIRPVSSHPTSYSDILVDKLISSDLVTEKEIKICDEGKRVEVYSSSSTLSTASLEQTISFHSASSRNGNETVKSACFASFSLVDGGGTDLADGGGNEEAELQPALVILTKDFVRFYFFNGESFLISVPFSVSEIRAIEDGGGGLLIEREAEEGDDSDSMNIPTLFTLFHPAEEIKPVFIQVGVDSYDDDDQEDLPQQHEAQDIDMQVDAGKEIGKELKDKQEPAFLKTMGKVVLVCKSWLVSVQEEKDELYIYKVARLKNAGKRMNRDYNSSEGTSAAFWMQLEEEEEEIMSIKSRMSLVHYATLSFATNR